MKFCLDCKHVKAFWWERFFRLDANARCIHPELLSKAYIGFHSITGRRKVFKREPYRCATNRQFECGSDAIYFEARK